MVGTCVITTIKYLLNKGKLPETVKQTDIIFIPETVKQTIKLPVLLVKIPTTILFETKYTLAESIKRSILSRVFKDAWIPTRATNWLLTMPWRGIIENMKVVELMNQETRKWKEKEVREIT